MSSRDFQAIVASLGLQLCGAVLIPIPAKAQALSALTDPSPDRIGGQFGKVHSDFIDKPSRLIHKRLPLGRQ